MSSFKDIEDFVQQNTRNRIVFCSNLINDIDFVDVGHTLSLAIQEKVDANFAIGQLLGDTKHHSTIGNYLALKNIGILFEPELKLNLYDIFMSISKNQCLIIQVDPCLMPLLQIPGLPYVVLNDKSK